MTREEAYREIEASLMTAQRRMRCAMGVADGWAQQWFLYGVSAVKSRPDYRHRLRQKLREACREYHRWEAGVSRMKVAGVPLFRVSGMHEEMRRRFNDDITDSDLLEMWFAQSVYGYEKTRPWMLALQNKLRLACIEQGWSEEMAPLLTAQYALGIASSAFTSACAVYSEGLTAEALHKLFDAMDISRVGRYWGFVLDYLVPGISRARLSDTTQKNIDMSVEQILGDLFDTANMLRGVEQSVEDYADVFRTDGFMRKSLAEVRQRRKQIEEAT